jgi:hypothetical protein
MRFQSPIRVPYQQQETENRIDSTERPLEKNMTTFQQLNEGWNADPNAPQPRVGLEGKDLVLSFLLNPLQFPQFTLDDLGILRFIECQRYRLGPTNDEGWYFGKCRFSKVAPSWGEFYEVSGDLRLDRCPSDWIQLGNSERPLRHFLFYLKDETFECDASDWHFKVLKKEAQSTSRRITNLRAAGLTTARNLS